MFALDPDRMRPCLINKPERLTIDRIGQIRRCDNEVLDLGSGGKKGSYLVDNRIIGPPVGMPLHQGIQAYQVYLEMRLQDGYGEWFVHDSPLEYSAYGPFVSS